MIKQNKIMSVKRLLYFVLLFLSTTSTFGQQPAYFILGKDEFEGTHIYDVIQDQQLNYWFATNEGIIKYDCYNFQKVATNQMKGSSVFGFVMNSEGTIFCHNLNNQIFQIKNGKCNLFYELDESQSTPDISLCITYNDELWVGAKKIFILSKKGTVVDSFFSSKFFISKFIYTTSTKSILAQIIGTDSVVIYNQQGFSIKEFRFTNHQTVGQQNIFRLFTISDKSYALDISTKCFYNFDEKSFELELLTTKKPYNYNEASRLYIVNNFIWVADRQPGIVCFDDLIEPESVNPFYQNYFISDVYQDQEGNHLLSTFNKGVIVIPDIRIPDVLNNPENDQIISIQNDEKYGVVCGTSNGKLILYTADSYSILVDNGIRSVETVYSNPKYPFIIFDNGHIRAYDKRTKEVHDIYSGSLKDAVQTDSRTIYLSTNYGIIKVNWDGNKRFESEKISGLNSRTYAVEADTLTGDIYTSTANGFRLIDSTDTIKEILYKNSQIYTNHLLYKNDKLYASTKKHGILVLKNGKVIEEILPKLNNEILEIFRFTIHNDRLLAKTEAGLIQFDMKGNIVRQMNKAFGFASNRIIDFDVSDSNLWISHSGGLQKLNLNQLKDSLAEPFIRIASLLVNDEPVSMKDKNSYESNQRKFQFILSSPTLKNRDNIIYHYKLKGYDNNWTIADYLHNQITYNALAYGSYTFIVKAENQGTFSQPVTYSFTISAPFYIRWWFILTCVFLFLLIVFLIYKRQLKAQQKKAHYINQINASKLVAIQSQMNPHFIFNSLNSIQDLVLKGDIDNTYTFITKFSNLVRRTLNYSDKEFIDFEQELKLIELYLSLEKLRFKKDFVYTIETNDITDIQLPPMLIQPFIENALVHGLLHKEGEKKLTISFKLDEHLICTIVDNGIGRKQAKLIKERQRSNHESFSVQAIKKRFEILSNHFKGELGYSYEDLEKDGQAVGTKVSLQIPIKRKY